MVQRPAAASGPVEVLEIKNVCPFLERARVNRRGHLTRTYFVSSRGPSQSVLLPQLLAPSLSHLPCDIFSYTITMVRCSTVFLFTMARCQMVSYIGVSWVIGSVVDVLCFGILQVFAVCAGCTLIVLAGGLFGPCRRAV